MNEVPITWLRRRTWAVALLGLLAPMAACAWVLAEPAARAVRMVVDAQLDALAAGDAERAFSLASPTIRAQFGDAASFMAMVRGGYPMMVGPAAVSFFQPQQDDEAEEPGENVLQAVQLRDRDGQLWMATYLLERQAGGGWRINGCAVVADSGKSST